MKEYNVDELLCLIVLSFLGFFVIRYLLNCKCVEGIIRDGPIGRRSARGHKPPAPPPPPTRYTCMKDNGMCVQEQGGIYTSKGKCQENCKIPSPDGPSPPSPSPLVFEGNSCDKIVANKWKNLICNQKYILKKSNASHDAIYKEINTKLQKIKNKEENKNLHPFSFDPQDKPYVGCKEYDDNNYNGNYCIQINQGEETCKPDYGSKSVSSDKICKTYTDQLSCLHTTGCAWRRPNLVDSVEELSVQPGTCPRTQVPGTQLLTPYDLKNECVGDNFRTCYTDSSASGSLYGELAISDIIGKSYNDLESWCGNRNDLMPFKLM